MVRMFKSNLVYMAWSGGCRDTRAKWAGPGTRLLRSSPHLRRDLRGIGSCVMKTVFWQVVGDGQAHNRTTHTQEHFPTEWPSHRPPVAYHHTNPKSRTPETTIKFPKCGHNNQTMKTPETRFQTILHRRVKVPFALGRPGPHLGGELILQMIPL